MRGCQRASNRATLFDVSLPRRTGHARKNNAQLSSVSCEAGAFPFTSAVMTYSELATLETTDGARSDRSASFEVAPSDTNENTIALSSRSSSVMDVDAFDDTMSDAERRVSEPSSGHGADAGERTAFTTISTSSGISPARPRLVDSVVLSYRDSCSSWRTKWDADAAPDMPLADELLSVAVDDSRIFLRRGGRVEVQSSINRKRPLRLRAWTELDDEQAGGASPATWQPSSSDPASALSGKDGKAAFLPVYTTRWKQEASLLLSDGQAQLCRVHPCGGAQSSLLFSGGSGNAGRASCRADFIALSHAAVSLVHAREYGAELTALQHVPFDGEGVVNATCMDDWGHNCTVIGFSDGTLRVVDWRAPRSRETASSNLFVTRAPQPRWLGTRRRNSLVFTTVAGVLSCCALEDSFRVVCGLGDASGTVTVADLRKPEAPMQHKRGRRGTTEAQLDALFSDSGGRTVTGRAVADIRRDPCCFGRLGLVDVAGTSAFTHIAALEGTSDDANVGASTHDNSGAESVLSHSLRPTAASEAHAGFSSGRHRRRLPSPPPPWQVLARTERVSLTSSAQEVSQRGAQTTSTTEPVRFLEGYPTKPRCVFTSDGSFLAHTHAVRHVTPATTTAATRIAATLRSASTGSFQGASCTPSHFCGSTHAQVISASSNTAAFASSFVAVSSVDRIVCFDSSDGNTLSVVLS